MKRPQEEYGHQDLTTSEINWMKRQGNGHNLLKWTSLASGGWWIRKGNYITLDEVFAPLSRSPCSSSSGTIQCRKLLGLRNVADMDCRAFGGKLC